MLLYDNFFPKPGQKKKLDIIMITSVSYILGGGGNYISTLKLLEIKLLS